MAHAMLAKTLPFVKDGRLTFFFVHINDTGLKPICALPHLFSDDAVNAIGADHNIPFFASPVTEKDLDSIIIFDNVHHLFVKQDLGFVRQVLPKHFKIPPALQKHQLCTVASRICQIKAFNKNVA